MRILYRVRLIFNLFVLCAGVMSSCSDAEVRANLERVEKDKAKYNEARREVQSHIVNRDYKSALVAAKTYEGEDFQLTMGSYTPFKPDEFVDSFLDAEEYELALQLMNKELDKKLSRHAGIVQKIAVGLCKQNKIDLAYRTAKSYRDGASIGSPEQFHQFISPMVEVMKVHVTDLCEKGKIKEANKLIAKEADYIGEHNTKELKKLVNELKNAK